MVVGDGGDFVSFAGRFIEPALPERQQFQLFESALRDPNRFGETLARLSALVGVENVGIAEVADPLRPEHRQSPEPCRCVISRAAGCAYDHDR